MLFSKTMNINGLLKVLFVFIHYLFYSHAHSASSSSALASSSIKFKNPKLDKETNIPGRKNRIEIDDELDEEDGGSKWFLILIKKNRLIFYSRISIEFWWISFA